ncbi:MAG: tryptophan synthase alpha chain [Flavobacteriales bacterium]|jgi:tryptophan synthase alpha chain
MNRLTTLLNNKTSDILSIYVTAGYPDYDSSLAIVQALDKAPVDFIELGMPFSDPLADGPTIQETSKMALAKGMDFKAYFKLAESINSTTNLPMVFMGYYNQVLKIGVENFCQKCQSVGIDGVIIPDLPLDEYLDLYEEMFAKYEITISFLVTPNTSEARIKKLGSNSSSFVYVVSDNTITGSSLEKSEKLNSYLVKTKELVAPTPSIVGFGIHDKGSYRNACEHVNGAIIGTAFLKSIELDNPVESCIKFINQIKS